MLTKIDIDSQTPFYLSVVDAHIKDSLLVRSVTGIEPPEINPFISDYARDGGSYQGRRVGNRNIVITMYLNPNPALGETISGLRELLYQTFLDPQSDGDYLKLAFHLDDDRVLYAVGYTEKFETEVFSDDTLVQISLLCPDPYLRDEQETVLSNPDGWLTVPFAYNGTARTGVEAELYVSTDTDTLILDNNSGAGSGVSSTDPAFVRGRMIFNHDFVTGDIVYVNTIRGSRSLLKASSSDVTSPMAAMSMTDRWKALEDAELTVPIINDLTPSSPWLELRHGANFFRIYGATPASTIATIKRIEYLQAYWGI